MLDSRHHNGTDGASSNKPSVIILSEIDWDFFWQRHQIFATQYARKGHKVFYVNRVGVRFPRMMLWRQAIKKLWLSIFEPKNRKSKDYIWVVNVIFLPINNWFCLLMNKWIFIPYLDAKIRARHGRVILHVYQPTVVTQQIISHFKNARVLYDCVHDFDQHPNRTKEMRNIEQELMTRADVITTDSVFLYEKIRSQQHRPILVPPGVDSEFFRQAYRGNELKRCREWIYYGHVRDILNFDLLNHIADETDYNLTIMGNFVPKKLSSNINFIKQQPFWTLPKILKEFDVLLLPYITGGLSQHILPAKFFECLAMGKPIVATKISGISGRYYSAVGILDEDFRRTLPETVRKLKKNHNAERNISLTLEASWESRFAEFYEKILLA